MIGERKNFKHAQNEKLTNFSVNAINHILNRIFMNTRKINSEKVKSS